MVWGKAFSAQSLEAFSLIDAPTELRELQVTQLVLHLTTTLGRLGLNKAKKPKGRQRMQQWLESSLATSRAELECSVGGQG